MDLKPLFEPKSLAVVGVSLHNDLHPSNIIFYKNLYRYPVEAYPVNPKAGILKGVSAYPSVKDLPEVVDLAIVSARAEAVPGILQDCVEAGVKGAAIISGGFSEVGNRDLQNEIVSIAKEADFPFIGPNCLGIYSPPYYDSFFFAPERISVPRQGNVAIISQSGGLLVDQMIGFSVEGVGLSLAVSIGNKAMVRETDLLEYLEHDDKTKVICLYIEGFREDEGREFLLKARECEKPIVVLKAGKSPGGRKAVSSHTASLAGDYTVFSALLSQNGIVEARDPSELMYFCESLSAYQTPIHGNVSIITLSGGHGALATDLCFQYGLTVPTFSRIEQDMIRKRLKPAISSIATCTNPVDLTGSSTDDDYVEAARVIGSFEEVECLVMLLLPYAPGLSSDLGARLSIVSRQAGKPMIAYLPRLEKYRMLIEGFEINGVPVAHTIEGAIQMVLAMARYRKFT
ncbi:MAG: CoA-binding protein [Bacteriovoracaceae bacterium]|jgi:acetyltransferase|nr:CoA-binding protein [Deltaproteobacteria bacterium]NLW67419.1 CoA-binding protein [Bacteriovoracaceae bacterium]HRR20562.1 CoA-binding protein [Desulfomonilia bacterium]HOE72842.1 CoA-binding protein [Deltaproteobacteria bacterium]HOS28900.1 CoA-binding protein [Deltaproteobacteria bacterium]